MKSYQKIIFTKYGDINKYEMNMTERFFNQVGFTEFDGENVYVVKRETVMLLPGQNFSDIPNLKLTPKDLEEEATTPQIRVACLEMNIRQYAGWTIAAIKEAMERDARLVERVIVEVYQMQTMDEQRTDSTSHNNGVGFTGTDAEFLSSLARWILAGRTLSVRQLEFGRKKALKYAGQFKKIAANPTV